MRISELAKATGASIRSLRHYEKKGLLSAGREENGYRVYLDVAIEQVKAIQLYLGLGLNTEEIARILACQALATSDGEQHVPIEEGTTSVEGLSGLLRLYAHKMHAIDQEMEALSTIKARLSKRMNWVQEKKALIEQSNPQLIFTNTDEQRGCLTTNKDDFLSSRVKTILQAKQHI